MILSAVLVLAPQQIGGSWERFHALDGAGGQQSLAVLGDVDGDQTDDFAIGDPATLSVEVVSGATGASLYRLTRQDAGFGSTLAALGDLDSDGHADFAIGAPQADANGLVGNGVVEVVSGANGSTIYVRTGLVHNGRFGASLTSVAHGSGAIDLLVSAPEVSPNPSGGRGVAYLYSGMGILRFSVDGPDALSSMGWNTADVGSYGGAGSRSFAIGVPHAIVNGVPGVGKVVVYSASSGAVLDVITRSSSLAGTTITRVPDIDGDGRDELAFTEGGVFGATQAHVHLYGSTSGHLLTIIGRAYSLFGAALLADDFDHDGAPELAIGDPSHSVPAAVAAGAVWIHRLPGGEQAWLYEGCADRAGLGTSLHAAVLSPWGGPAPDFVAETRGLTTRIAEVFGYDDHLSAFPAGVGARAGGRVRFQIDFPPSEAGRRYLMLASLAGTGSTNFGGVQVPLARDALYTKMLLDPPGVLHHERGTLDSAGDARAMLDLPPRVALPWAGRTLHFAAVTVHGWLASISSCAARVDIL